jgi:hypothetical protein
MKTRYYVDSDEWTDKGARITDAETLQLIQATLDRRGPVIIEHWYYCGSRAPNRQVFDNYEELMAYFDEHCCAGDAIHAWSFTDVCLNDSTIADGKCPDDDGRVPNRGAY